MAALLQLRRVVSLFSQKRLAVLGPAVNCDVSGRIGKNLVRTRAMSLLPCFPSETPPSSPSARAQCMWRCDHTDGSEDVVAGNERVAAQQGGKATLTALSQPPETNRRTGCPGATPDTRLPFGSAGAHDTAVAPSVCAPSSCRVQKRTMNLSTLAMVSEYPRAMIMACRSTGRRTEEGHLYITAACDGRGKPFSRQPYGATARSTHTKGPRS